MGVSNCLKFALKCLALLVVFSIGLVFLPGLPPTQNMQFTPYEVVPPRKLEGPLALNSKLENSEKLFHNMIKGPESIVEHEGVLYTGLHEGQHEEHICGRPLGLYIKDKSLYVADAYYGLFKVNLTTSEVIQLVTPDTVIEGRKAKLFNAVVVASDGIIYWTDSDSNVDLKNLMIGSLADGTGRLIRLDPERKSNTVLVDRLQFANGIALSQDESFIIVAESMKFRVLKHHLKGNKKGKTEIFADGLPGLPDNVKLHKSGYFYVNLIQARDAELTPKIIQNLSKYPHLRKFIAHTLALIQTSFTTLDNVFPHYVFKKIIHAVGHFETFSTLIPQISRTTILKLDKTGEVVESLHALDKSIEGISDVEFVGDYAYLGSPYNSYLARVKLNQK